MLLGGLTPVGLTATAVSPVVAQSPVPLGGWVRTRLSKSKLEFNVVNWVSEIGSWDVVRDYTYRIWHKSVIQKYVYHEYRCNPILVLQLSHTVAYPAEGELARLQVRECGGEASVLKLNELRHLRPFIHLTCNFYLKLRISVILRLNITVFCNFK